MEQNVSGLQSFGWKLIYPSDKMYSCKDAAEFLGLPLQEVYALRRSGNLPFIESQGMYFFEIHYLVKWITVNQPGRLIEKQHSWRNFIREIKYYLDTLIIVLK